MSIPSSTCPCQRAALEAALAAQFAAVDPSLPGRTLSGEGPPALFRTLSSQDPVPALMHALSLGETPRSSPPANTPEAANEGSERPRDEQTAHAPFMTLMGGAAAQEAPSLWKAMYEGTRAIHKEIVNNEFLQGLTKKQLACSRLHLLYLFNLLAVHRQLEATQQACLSAGKAVSFIKPELWRSTAIESDIKSWSWPGLTNIPFQLKEPTRVYIEHLKELAQTRPELAAGAWYVFYGTLMQGGQRVGPAVQEIFHKKRRENHLAEMPDHNAAELFSLPFRDIATFRQEWHQAFNALPEELHLTQEEVPSFTEALLEEATLAFRTAIGFLEAIVEEGRPELA